MSIYQNDHDLLISRAIASFIVSVVCFGWFMFTLDDLFPLAACVFMACKSIYELSFTQ